MYGCQVLLRRLCIALLSGLAAFNLNEHLVPCAPVSHQAAAASVLNKLK